RRLLKETRAELHERVADWFEQKTGGLLGGEHDELVGYHLEQAHVCRAELGESDSRVHRLGERAGELLALAARRALDLDDLPSAAGLSGRALDRLDRETTRADVLLVRCESLLATGDITRGAQAVAELERVAAGSPRLRAWATCYSGELANMTDPSRLRETEARVSLAADEFMSRREP